MAAVSIGLGGVLGPALASTSAVVIRSMTCQCGDGGPLSRGGAGEIDAWAVRPGREQSAQADLRGRCMS